MQLNNSYVKSVVSELGSYDNKNNKGKATFVTLLGLEAARARSEQEISAAKTALERLKHHMNEDSAALAFLSFLADFVLTRRN